MRIRKLTAKRYDEIIELWARANLPCKPRRRDAKESIIRQMKATPDFFRGAFEDGQLLGVSILALIWQKAGSTA